MKSKHQRTLTTTLELSPEEALWLKHQMQNYKSGPALEDEEDADDRAMRLVFSDALPDFPELETITVGTILGDE